MRWWKQQSRRGSAAIEFAIACPVMLAFFGGLVDFGLATWDKSILANAVAQGGYYAFVTGVNNVTAAGVQSIVQNSTSLSGVQASVTDLGACYCITGTPLALTTATCNSTCAYFTTAGAYVNISATYNYYPIMPFYSHLNVPTTLTEKTTMRLQ